MKGITFKVAIAFVALVAAYTAHAAWTITNPPAQTPPYSIWYDQYLQCDGDSDVLGGQIEIKAGASAEQEWEIETTLMTDGSGEWSGGIGDGSWDFFGQHAVAIYEVEVVPAKASRVFEVVE